MKHDDIPIVQWSWGTKLIISWVFNLNDAYTNNIFILDNTVKLCVSFTSTQAAGFERETSIPC